MLPGQLSPSSFDSYPPQARQLASRNIAILQRLPLAFVPLLLRELIGYDWKFPAERVDLDRQFAYLGSLAAAAFRAAMAPFASLKISRELEQIDWVNSPAIFSEQLSAHLWSTHQIDAFSRAAVDYVARAEASAPDPALPVRRLGIAVIGQGIASNGIASNGIASKNYRLFRKLRPHGVYYTQVKPGGGARALLDRAAARAAAHPAPFAHWYIDGGAPLDDRLGGNATPAGVGVGDTNLTRVSYHALSSARVTLQNIMRKSYEAPTFDPEAFRTMLAQIKPEQAGLRTGNETLDRFQLSLLTEGSGTQVFSTTFVQWAAREALRRAQPLTLLIRFAPRQREAQMNELLAEHQRPPELDAAGSLIDGDMGAYYTWVNQQRLAGAGESAFLAWFEDHGEAVAIGPNFEAGKRSDAPIELAKLAEQVA